MKRWWLIPVCCVLLLPVVYLIKGSFEGAVGLIKMPPSLIPRGVTLQNYGDLIRGCGMFGRWVFNTAVLAFVVSITAISVTLCAGYAMAQKFPGHMIAFWLVVVSVVVPGMVLIIPRFLTMRLLHIPFGFVSAWLPLAYSPISILLARAWMLQIGTEYIEQARLEGASEWRIVAQCIAPMCKPIIAIVIIHNGVAALGDYMWQNMVLRWPEQQTLIVGMLEFMSRYSGVGMPNPLGMRMAMAVILLIPTVGIFTIGHRWFVGEGKGLEW